MKSSVMETDILIVGSGLAALAFALKVTAENGSQQGKDGNAEKKKVLLVTKEKVHDANSAMAQGGIASVSLKEDSFESHIEDTLNAGAGLCNEDAVRNIVEQAPERIHDLMDWGVKFDQTLVREGGHSHRRIYHFEDQTGLHIHHQLLSQVRIHPDIEILENCMGIDLILNKQINPNDMSPKTCVGLYVFDKSQSEVITIKAKITVLATGGAGKVYLYTSNWEGATGDGIAMAHRAGARISNLEFMQFHPTCLYHANSRNFLISEALRGEGGELLNSEGQAFMKKHHPMGSLAPRDIVARSIDAEMKKTGKPCVYLDMTHQPKDFLLERFPAIAKRCLELGIDIATQPLPVVPAAHYLCGGVLTDLNGRTDIDQLWALGETACTGLHGANRLASNSLLECLAMAHNCSEEVKKIWQQIPDFPHSVPEWVKPLEKNEDELIVISHMWDEIRRLMWNYVGIVRSNKRLERAKHRLVNILQEVKEYYSNFQLNSDLIELRNIAIVADLTVECALRRKESRGIHYNLDYPPENQIEPQNTILY